MDEDVDPNDPCCAKEDLWMFSGYVTSKKAIEEALKSHAEYRFEDGYSHNVHIQLGDGDEVDGKYKLGENGKIRDFRVQIETNPTYVVLESGM